MVEKGKSGNWELVLLGRLVVCNFGCVQMWLGMGSGSLCTTTLKKISKKKSGRIGVS